MLKRLVAALVLPIILMAFIPCTAAETPVVPRVYRTEMDASIAYYNGEKLIALDIGIVDITEPSGLLGFEFNVLFDGNALEPIWQTDYELNGDGVSYSVTTPPQMVTNWPTFYFSYAGLGGDIFACEGFCKSYEKTGSGVLNVNLVTNIDVYDFAVFGDNEMAIRLYFRPKVGFVSDTTYTFTIDGQYSEPIKQNINIGGVNNALPMPGVAYGYGDSTNCTVTWADCGAFDLADTSANIVPDGNKNILWVAENYTAASLKACFSGAIQVLNASGASVSNTVNVDMGFMVKTSEGSLTVAKIGDINCDGVVSTLDYTMLKGVLSGSLQLSDLQAKIADIGGDGAITTNDAVWFNRYFECE